MRLQKVENRIVKGVKYAKWTVVIPPSTIEELGWKAGDELIEEVLSGELRLLPKRLAKRAKQ